MKKLLFEEDSSKTLCTSAVILLISKNAFRGFERYVSESFKSSACSLLKCCILLKIYINNELFIFTFILLHAAHLLTKANTSSCRLINKSKSLVKTDLVLTNSSKSLNDAYRSQLFTLKNWKSIKIIFTVAHMFKLSSLETTLMSNVIRIVDKSLKLVVTFEFYDNTKYRNIGRHFNG